MSEAHVTFHQGWTDIICQLPLINYYAKQYHSIKVYIRLDAKNIVDFYTRKLNNVNLVYIDTPNGIDVLKDGIPSDGDLLFHGQYDIYRKDKYKNICKGECPGGYCFFIECFYRIYDIPYMVRINDFIFERDLELEEYAYKKFIDNFSKDYIICHYDENNSSNSRYHINTKLNIKSNFDIININRMSDTLFDFIKIFMNAKEIHLIDSVWGALIYQIDAKYRLFADKKIYLYPKRGHIEMFTKPLVLDNWKIIL